MVGFPLQILSSIVILLAIAFGIFMLMSRDSLIANGGTTYELLLPDSRKTEAEGTQYVATNETTATASPSSNKTDCGSRGAKVVDTIELYGKKVSVCQNTKPPAWIYTANFEHNGDWHIVTVFSKDKTKPVDKQQALEAIKSVQIK